MSFLSKVCGWIHARGQPFYVAGPYRVRGFWDPLVITIDPCKVKGGRHNLPLNYSKGEIMWGRCWCSGRAVPFSALRTRLFVRGRNCYTKTLFMKGKRSHLTHGPGSKEVISYFLVELVLSVMVCGCLSRIKGVLLLSGNSSRISITLENAVCCTWAGEFHLFWLYFIVPV